MSSRATVGTEFRFWAPGKDSATVITNVNFHEYITENSGYDANLKAYFIIHGYQGGNAKWAVAMKNALMQKERCNVFIVDWSGGDGFLYGTARANTWIVGAELGRFVERIGIKTGMKPSQVHVIGHSLGAHAAGFAGNWILNKLGTKFGRITGLDPAGEDFTDVNKNERLDKEDADFVDIIHTNYADSFVQGYGLEKSIGHLDFYPNGGENQPGCVTVVDAEIEITQEAMEVINPYYGLFFSDDDSMEDAIDDLSCSHTRAVYFFTESIQNQGCRFLATECPSWRDYVDGKCSDNAQVPMGFDSEMFKSLARSDASRRFYLTTNAESPYCQQ